MCGCIAGDNNHIFSVRAFQAEAIDTTGAGDTFVGAFIAALLQGKTLEECCRFSNAAASITVQHIGAAAGVESIDQIERIVRERFDK